MAVAPTLPTDGVAPTPALRTATGTASPFPVDSPKTACPQESAPSPDTAADGKGERYGTEEREQSARSALAHSPCQRPANIIVANRQE